jgi:hypothetical protein
LIIGDSYFGGLDTLKGLAIEGKFGLFSCSSTRPSFLFKDNLTEKVTTDDSSSSLFGRIELAECELSKNFIANCFQSRGRKLYTLATCFSDELAEVNIKGMEIDSECDDQQVLLII